MVDLLAYANLSIVLRQQPLRRRALNQKCYLLNCLVRQPSAPVRSVCWRAGWGVPQPIGGRVAWCQPMPRVLAGGVAQCEPRGGVHDSSLPRSKGFFVYWAGKDVM